MFPGISNFLEEISSLSHSIVFLYFFTLITEECFLLSPCYSLELCIQMVISFLFSFAFRFSSFSAICKASSDNHFAFLHFFSWESSWSLSPVQCHELPSIVLQALYLSSLIPWIYFSLPLYNCKGFDLGHTILETYPYRLKCENIEIETSIIICGIHNLGEIQRSSSVRWEGEQTDYKITLKENQDNLVKISKRLREVNLSECHFHHVLGGNIEYEGVKTQK